jgi:hypothetical protein
MPQTRSTRHRKWLFTSSVQPKFTTSSGLLEICGNILPKNLIFFKFYYIFAVFVTFKDDSRVPSAFTCAQPNSEFSMICEKNVKAKKHEKYFFC